MSQPFVGEIQMFGGNYAPRGYALCDGTLLPISQNTALFSILGTTYGGDGETTFGLPALRGRIPVHAGNGPGLTDRRLGEKSGTETTTLTENQMPSHAHAQTAPVLRAAIHNTMDPTVGAPNTNDPTGATLGSVNLYYFLDSAFTVDAEMADGSVDHPMSDNTGGGQSYGNMAPFLTINFIIALVGIFPSTN